MSLACLTCLHELLLLVRVHRSSQRGDIYTNTYARSTCIEPELVLCIPAFPWAHKPSVPLNVMQIAGVPQGECMYAGVRVRRRAQHRVVGHFSLSTMVTSKLIDNGWASDDTAFCVGHSRRCHTRVRPVSVGSLARSVWSVHARSRQVDNLPAE